ncbi:MAG: dihydropteroate synthase [Solirubrobacterales bacterium]
MPAWRLRECTLGLEQPIAAGIVNVTEDSFFKGARSGTPDQAIADGVRLAADGFEMLDVGAVAAHSGPPVPAAEEVDKLVPAITGLAAQAEVPISADTFSAEVALAALEAGAEAINDISGGGDESLFEVAAQTGAGYVLTHSEGPPRMDRDPPHFEDPIDYLKDWFSRRIEAALGLGVAEQQIVIDPGLDFDIGVHDGLEVLRRLSELRELGRPLYVSLSRKDLLGAALGGSWETRVEPARREWATAAASALAIANGADILRLHDRSALQALRVAERIVA